MCLPQHMETPPNPCQDHWNWQHFLDCRDLRRDVDTKLNAPRFGRLDKICVQPCLCVSEVLMTVLRGPSQHQICVFIPLWNTVSPWMLTVWCLLNHSSHPHQRASFLHLSRISKSVYIHYVYVRVLCVCKLCEFCQNLCVCLHVCDCACISVRAGWSLCVVAPNWGSDTAVLSLAFPSFSSLSAC